MPSKSNKGLDEINDELTTLIRQRDKLIIETNKVAMNVAKLLETKYELEPSMVRITCVQCGGRDYVEGKDGNKVKCPLCNGDKYNWAKLHTEEE